MAQAMTVDTLAAVRVELAALIAAIDVKAPHGYPRDLIADVDAIRRVAYRNGMNPVVTVAHFLEAALSRGQPANAIHDWLAMLREAVGSDAQGVDACHAVAAVCSARLAA